MPETRAPLTPEGLFEMLARLDIPVTTVRHPPLHTVEESRRLRGEIVGGHTKNLFLKDRKDQYFLLTVGEDAVVDLKTVHRTVGAASRLSFGSAEALHELLGVRPGAVTVLGAANDAGNRVTVILDERLAANDIINAHPLTNDATTSIATADLRRFLTATGHGWRVLALSEGEEAARSEEQA